MQRFTGAKPPDGDPELSAYLTCIACFHEAAHAVAAYHFRYPHMSANVPMPIVDSIHGAHLERDHDAVEIGRLYLRGLRANEARMVLYECVVGDIAYHVNRHINGVPQNEASRYASDDGDFLAEMFEMSGSPPDEQEWFFQNSATECARLIDSPSFRAAVEAVADAIYDNNGTLSEMQIGFVIEQTVGDVLRNASFEPTHDQISLAAYYLSLGRGPESDAFHNWLTAERGLRFGISSEINNAA